MKRLLAIALVTLMAAGAVNAQAVLDAQVGGGAYVDTGPRDQYAYLEGSESPYFLPAGTYNFYGVADDIRFDAPISMRGFTVDYFSRITASALPLTMTVNFYSFYTSGGYIYYGDTSWGSWTIDGLGTGNNTVTVDTGPTYLPAGVWFEVGFTDVNGNFAVDTGVKLSSDWQAEVGITSNDYYFIMNSTGAPGGLYWFGGYTPTLPLTDPNWNPAANYVLSISIPEPLTLGLVALGGLLAVRRRR
jgi:hypothetical protein